jgi:hypothetical protein
MYLGGVCVCKSIRVYVYIYVYIYIYTYPYAYNFSNFAFCNFVHFIGHHPFLRIKLCCDKTGHIIGTV